LSKLARTIGPFRLISWRKLPIERTVWPSALHAERYNLNFFANSASALAVS
jgi:hypothetical protein